MERTACMDHHTPHKRKVVFGEERRPSLEFVSNQLNKSMLVKRLKRSLLHQKKKSKDEILKQRVTTIRESTLSMIKKAKSVDKDKAKKEAMDASKKSTNMIDPITRERLSQNPQNVFYFKRSPQSTTRLDANALIDYALATGDFCDPESRIPFDDASLGRLDQIGCRLGKPSLVKAKKDLTAAYADRQFKRDALCGLERVCGLFVSEMFDCVESVHEHERGLDEAQILLLTSIFPEFQHNFNQLAQADEEFAQQSAMQFQAFLRGPPNKQVKDSPIQRIVLDNFASIVEEAFE